MNVMLLMKIRRGTQCTIFLILILFESFWIFMHKNKYDGSFERYKVLLVGDCVCQQNGMDYGETFNSVVKLTTTRTILNDTLSKSWFSQELDVKNAFLQGNLDETIYMYQPRGLRNSQHPDYVCLLRKSLYGLKQTSSEVYQQFTNYVATLDFSHIISDYSLFIYC